MTPWLLIWSLLFGLSGGGEVLEETLVCFPQVKYTPYGTYHSSHSMAPPKLVQYDISSGEKPLLDFGSQVKVKVTYEKNILENRRDECERQGGNYVNPNCYKFLRLNLNFEEARLFCIALGGELWIPDLEDPRLFLTLAENFPAVFSAHRNNVWVGIRVSNKRYITIGGNDVTQTYLGHIGAKRRDRGNCVAVHLNTGVVLHNTDCDCTTDFVCDLPLSSEDEIVTRKVLKYHYVDD